MILISIQLILSNTFSIESTFSVQGMILMYTIILSKILINLIPLNNLDLLLLLDIILLRIKLVFIINQSIMETGKHLVQKLFTQGIPNHKHMILIMLTILKQTDNNHQKTSTAAQSLACLKLKKK